MTDPKRWSEGGHESEAERELVLAGQAPGLPESERRALWASIALALPATAPPAAPAPTAVTPGPHLLKAGLFLAAFTGLTALVSQLLPPASPARSPGATSAPSPFRSANVAVAPTVPDATPRPELAPALPASAAPAVSALLNDAKPRATSASQLAEESLAVLEARSALRAGDAARSLALLEQARGRFAHGALGQEREALTIEALSKSGRQSEARRRAALFLRAHPNSPYLADVRRSVGQ